MPARPPKLDKLLLLFEKACLPAKPLVPDEGEFPSFAGPWVRSKIDAAPLLASGEVSPPVEDTFAAV